MEKLSSTYSIPLCKHAFMDNQNARNIVICCDGTGNQYGSNNTNVVKLFEMLIHGDGQKIFYDPGVGTSSNAVLKHLQKLNHVLSQALGLDLHKNVEDAYAYLMNVYQEGDRIFLFGFSRGAHTVRRLACVLEKCGLLHRGSDNMIPYVSRMYLEVKNPEVLSGFRKTFSRPCPVHFIGVWDTVSAVSSLLPRPKLDGVLSGDLNYAYHALAIDEKRYHFPPNLWIEKDALPHQTVEQVWFAGVHSDVGGWYKERGLSNTALKWLLEKALHAGLKVQPESLQKIPTNPLAKKHESWTGHWWFIPHHLYLFLLAILLLIIEFFLVWLNNWWELPYRPFSELVRVIQNNWVFTLVLVLALIPFTQKRRMIPPGSKIHSSVKTRYSNKEANYKPKNLEDVISTVQWVD